MTKANSITKYVPMFNRKIFRVVNHIKIILFLPIAIPTILIIRIIKPISYIRLGTISSGQIGHYALDAGILLCEKLLENNKTSDWYWIEKQACNSQVEKMVNRNFYVRWWVEYLYIANKVIPYGDEHTITPPRCRKSSSRDINGLLTKTRGREEAYLRFTLDEEIYANAFLRDSGLSKDDKFVCLIVRDSSYKNHISPIIDWTYHDYRDSDIDDYSLAAMELAERGYWVFRMGKIVSKPFDCDHPRVIDYAMNNERNDLLDVWLTANCFFCISTGSGLDAIATIFRRPLALINCLPVGDSLVWSHALTHPKYLRWQHNSILLTLREYFDNNYYSTNQYSEKGISVIDLTECEIKDVAIEFEGRVTGEFSENPEGIELQKNFRSLFAEWFKLCRISSTYIHPDYRLSSVFLENNKELFK